MKKYIFGIIIGIILMISGLIYGVTFYDENKTIEMTGTITDKQITADGQYIILNNQTIRFVPGKEYVTLDIGDNYTYQIFQTEYQFLTSGLIAVGFCIVIVSCMPHPSSLKDTILKNEKRR
jgi:hypothetical protein